MQHKAILSFADYIPSPFQQEWSDMEKLLNHCILIYVTNGSLSPFIDNSCKLIHDIMMGFLHQEASFEDAMVMHQAWVCAI